MQTKAPAFNREARPPNCFFPPEKNSTPFPRFRRGLSPRPLQRPKQTQVEVVDPSSLSAENDLRVEATTASRLTLAVRSGLACFFHVAIDPPTQLYPQR